MKNINIQKYFLYIYNILFNIIHLKNIFKFIILLLIVISIKISIIINPTNIKIALCAIGKKENLYINEFINYYLKLGIDKIFLYDDNELNTEKFSDILLNKNKIKIFENIKKIIKRQSDAYTHCYNNNKYDYDWFLMLDIDEFLIVVNNTLKKYLSNKIFDKCDFIKFHRIFTNDNNLLHYDNRSLFERFNGPYIKSKFVKSIIRGGIIILFPYLELIFYNISKKLKIKD